MSSIIHNTNIPSSIHNTNIPSSNSSQNEEKQSETQSNNLTPGDTDNDVLSESLLPLVNRTNARLLFLYVSLYVNTVSHSQSF